MDHDLVEAARNRDREAYADLIRTADHFGTTVAKESIEAILALASAK